MIVNSENLNTIADVANLGLVISLLGYNVKNYEMNKDILKVNKEKLGNKNIDDIYNVLSQILEELKDINSKMKEVGI